MKKKLCSILLALTMVLTLLPVSALAEEETPAEVEPEYVAQIGETKYETLAKAYAAVPNDGTLTTIDLLKSCSGAGIGSDGDGAKNYILDFHGYTYTVTSLVGSTNYESQALRVIAGQKVELKNGTLASDNALMMVHIYGDLKLDNMIIDGSNMPINANNAYTLSYCSGNSVITGNTRIIAKEGGKAFDVDGNYKNKSKNVSVTIDGGFTGTIDGAIEYAHGTGSNAHLTIAGGTFTNNSFSVIGVGENGKANISISGGAFTDLANAVKYATDGATIKLAGDVTVTKPIEVAKSMTLDLNGHVLTAATASNRSEPNDVKNSAIWVTAEKVNLTIDGTTAGSGMTMGDTHETEWTTKVWGFVDLREGSAGSTVTVNGGRYVGSTCASDNYHYTALFTVGSESKLVLNNVSAETDERVVKASGCGEVIVSGGTYNITGINAFLGAAFETKTASFTNMKLTAKYGGCVQVGNNATFENCEIKVTDIRTGEGTHLNCAVAVQYGGTATVKSGIYTAPYAAYVYSSGGTINIENGTFTGVVRADATTDATATINIKNGSFNGEIQKGAGAGNETIAITGGTYTSDPSAYVVPGYVASYNGSTYTVYYPVPVIPNNNNNSSSTTTKNPDGSTTTTTTDKATGAVTETTTTANGSVGTVKTDANGSTEISASISAADVSAAAKKNEPVTAPVSVAPAASSAAAPVIKLSVPANAGEVAVAIPVVNAKQGTVAVRVNPDGTEEIIKTSVITENGLVLGVKGSMQIKVINNSKNFVDTVGHWAASDVDFVSARELFNGTAPALFSPEASMTRGMVVTVIARLAGENTDGGANWYDKGCAWAVANGVSDGTDPNGSITREQLAAMLYRYCGSPAASGSLSTYADAASVSAFGSDAMQWCVNNGIINGMDGLLNPQGQATRAQVSAMFARYIRLAAAK